MYRAFIITLHKNLQSLETASSMIKPLQQNGFNVELFEGTYGNEAKILCDSENRTLHPIDHTGNKTKPNRKVCGLGVIGCFYSHYRLWKKCKDLNQTIFIFEDDVKFVRPYYPVEFDEILLVALGSWKSIYSVDIEENPNIKPKSLDVNIPCLPGAVGYGITPKAATKLLKNYANTYTAADSAIRSSVVDIKVHSHLIGRALDNRDGKISLTRKNNW